MEPSIEGKQIVVGAETRERHLLGLRPGRNLTSAVRYLAGSGVYPRYAIRHNAGSGSAADSISRESDLEVTSPWTSEMVIL